MIYSKEAILSRMGLYDHLRGDPEVSFAKLEEFVAAFPLDFNTLVDEWFKLQQPPSPSVLRTCAFCGYVQQPMSVKRVRVCLACNLPSCGDCLISYSARSTLSDPEVIQTCRHMRRVV